MDKWVEKPRRIGEILDLTFLVLRKEFAKILLIMLILTGPILIVQAIAMYSGGIPFFPGSGGSFSLESFLTGMGSTGVESAFINVGGMELGILIVTLILLVIILVPVAMASISILVQKMKNGEEITVGPIIRQAFSRFGALLGGSIVYFLIVMGLITVPTTVISLLFTFGAALVSPWLTVVGVVLILAVLCVATYLLTRWGFYFVAIVFEKVSPGLSKSWHLTKGQFWRIFGLFIVIYLISSIITFTFQFVSDVLLANTVIGYLITTLVTGLSYLIMTVAYTVIYFDLRVRNEGTDLHELVEGFESQIEEKFENSDEKEIDLDTNDTEK